MDNILVNLSLSSEEQSFSVALICWLVIYPVDSSFERLNNLALISFNKSPFLNKKSPICHTLYGTQLLGNHTFYIGSY